MRGRIGKFPRAVAVILAAGALGGGIYQTNHGNTSSSNWAGSFNCYSTPTSGCWTPNTCTVTATTSNLTDLQTKVNAATAGQTVCGNGTYTGTLTISSRNMGSRTYVQSADPNSPMSIDGGVRIDHSNNWTIQGVNLTFSGAGNGNSQSLNSTNVTFTHDLFDNNQLGLCAGDTLAFPCITAVGEAPVLTNANVLVDHNKFTNLTVASTSSHEGRVNIAGDNNYPGPGVNGFTIQYNLFEGGCCHSCSDGIRLDSASDGTRIQFNEFRGITQNNAADPVGGLTGCQDINAAHVDAMQGNGSQFTIVTGNWLHDNGDGSGGIEFWDTCSNDTFTNNVVAGNNDGGASSRSVAFNVHPATVNPACHSEHNVMQAHQSGGTQTSSPVSVVKNNIMSGFITGEDNSTEDYNYCFGNGQGLCVGAHDQQPATSGTFGMGAFTFVGGSSPSTYYGWELSSSSLGYHGASDGKSVGICSSCGS